jgi:glycosyltransferase involved in cell wall biosynthesis
MRIALTNNFFEPLATGSTHFTRELATQLTKNGHDVLVITATPAATGDQRVQPAAFPIERVRAWRINFGKAAYNYDIPFATRPSVIRSVNGLLDDFQPDVIHQNGQFFDLSFITGLWAKRKKVPTVLNVHTALLHESPRFDRLLRTADRYGVRPALSVYKPHLVSSDKRVGRYVADRYPKLPRSSAGYPVDITGVRNGDGEAIRSVLGIGDRPMILSIGHVIPMRNRVLLMQALAIVKNEVPDVVAVIVGKLYDRTFLDVADSLGITDAVVASGPVPHRDVKHYVAAANVESHDLQNVGIGISTLEAMAAGAPVVTVNDYDTFPYAPLTDGEDILIAEPTPELVATRLVSLLTDSELNRTVGAGGRAYVERNFAPESVAAEYEAIYAEVLGRS